MFQIKEKEVQVSKTIEKSRFHGFLFQCRNRIDHDSNLTKLHENFSDARHICYGFRILGENIPQPEVGFSDDGEPNGSAGKPILAPLQGRNIVGVAIYVIRYFGGVKLGVGGLIRAYGGVASDLIEQATLVPYEKKTLITIMTPYQHLASLEHHLKSLECIYRCKFGQEIQVSAEVNTKQMQKIYNRWDGYLKLESKKE